MVSEGIAQTNERIDRAVVVKNIKYPFWFSKFRGCFAGALSESCYEQAAMDSVLQAMGMRETDGRLGRWGAKPVAGLSQIRATGNDGDKPMDLHVQDATALDGRFRPWRLTLLLGHLRWAVLSQL